MNSDHNDWHEYVMGRMSVNQLPRHLQGSAIQPSNRNQNRNIITNRNNHDEDVRIEYENSIRLLNEYLPVQPPRLTRQTNYIPNNQNNENIQEILTHILNITNR